MDNRHERRLNVEYLNTRMGAGLAERVLTGGGCKLHGQDRNKSSHSVRLCFLVEVAD